jgi:hypothetical protein
MRQIALVQATRTPRDGHALAKALQGPGWQQWEDV